LPGTFLNHLNRIPQFLARQRQKKMTSSTAAGGGGGGGGCPGPVKGLCQPARKVTWWFFPQARDTKEVTKEKQLPYLTICNSCFTKYWEEQIQVGTKTVQAPQIGTSNDYGCSNNNAMFFHPEFTVGITDEKGTGFPIQTKKQINGVVYEVTVPAMTPYQIRFQNRSTDPSAFLRLGSIVANKQAISTQRRDVIGTTSIQKPDVDSQGKYLAYIPNLSSGAAEMKDAFEVLPKWMHDYRLEIEWVKISATRQVKPTAPPAPTSSSSQQQQGPPLLTPVVPLLTPVFPSQEGYSSMNDPRYFSNGAPPLPSNNVGLVEKQMRMQHNGQPGMYPAVPQQILETELEFTKMIIHLVQPQEETARQAQDQTINFIHRFIYDRMQTVQPTIGGLKHAIQHHMTELKLKQESLEAVEEEHSKLQRVQQQLAAL
jgi:hypothetical protein